MSTIHKTSPKIVQRLTATNTLIISQKSVNYVDVWTGANDIDKDGNYTFAVENGPFSLNNLPFGEVNYVHNSPCGVKLFAVAGVSWYWEIVPCSNNAQSYICEYTLQKDPEVVGVFNDHSNYFHNHTDIAAEAEITDPLYGKQQSWGLGRRIVELDLLAVGMYCCICKSPLHLSNTVGEKLFGLSGIIMIRCDLCATVTDVQTGKRGPTGSYDINTKAALGRFTFRKKYKFLA
ncbi:unnamed protein product [Mytilus edulis]|uniref:Uncharacterized protein n=1 Tax=Mytilus edulis TaxID=6550 RepID=A0A8S3SCS2_MYTED|nr:unnamed protein product [Mytilus edulis]